MAWWKVLHLIGLALAGVAIIFLFGYRPKDEARQTLFIGLSLSRLLRFVLQLGRCTRRDFASRKALTTPNRTDLYR
jgi:hypothetical protein